MLDDLLRSESDPDRLLAVRVVIHGPSTLHDRLHADPERYVAEVRNLALERGADRLWIEKVEIQTRPERTIVPDGRSRSCGRARPAPRRPGSLGATNLYLYARRTARGPGSKKLLLLWYIDIDDDAALESSDFLLGANFSADRVDELSLFAYVPAGTSDAIPGDGQDVPGHGLPVTGAVAGAINNANDVEYELSVAWSAPSTDAEATREGRTPPGHGHFSDLVGSTALDPDLHRRPRRAAIISHAAVSGDRLPRAAALTILSTPTWLTAKPSRFMAAAISRSATPLDRSLTIRLIAACSRGSDTSTPSFTSNPKGFMPPRKRFAAAGPPSLRRSALGYGRARPRPRRLGS